MNLCCCCCCYLIRHQKYGLIIQFRSSGKAQRKRTRKSGSAAKGAAAAAAGTTTQGAVLGARVKTRSLARVELDLDNDQDESPEGLEDSEFCEPRTPARRRQTGAANGRAVPAAGSAKKSRNNKVNSKIFHKLIL